jgi:hypothetical protein
MALLILGIPYKIDGFESNKTLIITNEIIDGSK